MNKSNLDIFLEEFERLLEPKNNAEKIEMLERLEILLGNDKKEREEKMENKLEVFKNKEFGEVRTINEDGKILFCGSDVAKALGYVDTAKAIKQHCKKDGWANYPVIDSMGRKQRAKYITESNLYRLIASSKLESAQKFESWIFDEVLPSIRKTGGYIYGEEKMNEEQLIATAMKVLDQKVEKLKIENSQKQQIINELKPKADYTDKILRNKSIMPITAIAKDYGMSGYALNMKLHDLGIQYNLSGQWLLYAKYQDKGYTHSETIPIKHHDGTMDTKLNTKWTQKGRLFLYELLKENGLLPMIEREAM